MNESVIEKYKKNCSMESISSDMKVGKLKIKKILTENNIPIRKRGGQVKYTTLVPVQQVDGSIKCKRCDKEFNDVKNKNGSITNHIETCYPEVEIPSSFKRRMYLNSTGNYWHLIYFDFFDKKQETTIKCLDCGWETKDTTNKTGSLTKHVESNHGFIDDYLTRHPSESYLFPSYVKSSELKSLFTDEKNFVSCRLCGEQFKSISSTHLLLHGTNPIEYKLKFGEDSLVSHNTKKLFINNLTQTESYPTYRSKSEVEIEEFLRSLGVRVIVCDKKQLSGIELDLYLPDHNIGIEYNGLYWHSENQGKNKNYHINKTTKCLEKNIHLIHIFSDEWLSKKEIIKNRLINLLKINESKIYARKCKVVQITKKEKTDFLTKNHIQGNDNSSIYFGLTYNNTLVSVMTFGKLRKILGNKQCGENTYELYRFCSNNVVGGFSKLLDFFINEYKPNRIITYANRNWSPSDKYCFYSKVGFTYIGETKPNYSYTKKYDIREHRFNYRKDRLVKMGHSSDKTETQIMYELGFDRIWDTGNLKYEINI
jgi:hypothetical protein